jgi:hypothetical protein
MSVRAALILLTFAVLGVALSSYVYSRPYMLETPVWFIEIAQNRGMSDKIGLSNDGDWLLYCSDKPKGDGWEFGVSGGPFERYRCREVWQRHGLWFHYMQKVNE